MTAFEVFAVAGIGEVTAGTDLAALVADNVSLRDGDILVVTSKVVSKAEGRVVTGDKAEAVADETDRVVARRGDTVIARTHHGLVMAGAGIDASNTAPGTLVLLPVDPDRSARALRAAISRVAGRRVAVVVSDTSGRAWRNGQTDIAIGAAGLRVLDDHAGRTDPYGNPLVVTAPALADELAGAGDLVKRKLARTPVAVVRGLGDLVLSCGEEGPGAGALVRDEASDMFGLGAREAVMAALAGSEARGFGVPASPEAVATALTTVTGLGADVVDDSVLVRLGDRGADPATRGRLEARLEVAARAHGWVAAAPDPGEDRAGLRFRPGLP